MAPSMYYVYTLSQTGFLPPFVDLLSESFATSSYVGAISKSDIKKVKVFQFQFLVSFYKSHQVMRVGFKIPLALISGPVFEVIRPTLIS